MVGRMLLYHLLQMLSKVLMKISVLTQIESVRSTFKMLLLLLMNVGSKYYYNGIAPDDLSRHADSISTFFLFVFQWVVAPTK